MHEVQSTSPTGSSTPGMMMTTTTTTTTTTTMITTATSATPPPTAGPPLPPPSRWRRPKAKRKRKGWGPYQSVTRERSVDFNLTLDVQALRQEIQQMTVARDLLRERRHAPSGALLEMAREYCRFFRHGFQVARRGPRRTRQIIDADAQCAFLRAIVDEDVDLGNGLRGVEIMIEQIRRYSVFLRFICMDMTQYEVLVQDDNVLGTDVGPNSSSSSAVEDESAQEIVIRASGTLHFAILRETVAGLFPHVLSDPWLLGRLVGVKVAPAASITFYFNPQGRLIRYHTALDFVQTFVEVLQDPTDVAVLLGRALIGDNCMLGVTHGQVQELEVDAMEPLPGLDHPNEPPTTSISTMTRHEAIACGYFAAVGEEDRTYEWVEAHVAPIVNVAGRQQRRDQLRALWGRFSGAFARVQLTRTSTPVLGFELDQLVVRCEGIYHLTMDRETIARLLPHVLSSSELVERLLGAELACPMTMDLWWADEGGLITAIDEVVDLDAGLMGVLPCPQDRAFVLSDAPATGPNGGVLLVAWLGSLLK